MDLSRERYRLCVYLRFADLESALGEGPRKITLQKLRKCGKWATCHIYNEASVEGLGDKARMPSTGVSEKLPTGVAGSTSTLPVEPDAENAGPREGKRSSRRRTHGFTSEREPVVAEGATRAQKRALRDREYSSRRARESAAAAARLREESHDPNKARLRARFERTSNQFREQAEAAWDYLDEHPVRGPYEVPPPFQSGYVGQTPLRDRSHMRVRWAPPAPQTNFQRPSRHPGVCPSCGSILGRPHVVTCPVRLARRAARSEASASTEPD